MKNFQTFPMNSIFYLHTEKKHYMLNPGKTYSIGRNPDNDIFLSDNTVSRDHLKLKWDGDTFIAEDLNSTNGTSLNGKKINSARLNANDILRLGAVKLQFTATDTGADISEDAISSRDSIIIENRINELMEEVRDPFLKEKFNEIKNLFMAKKKNLSDLAYKDTLTGLYNRRSFERKLSDEWKRQKRYKRPLSLIMIDIDHFKRVNDAYGHQKGDSVLKTVAQIIMDNIRSTDYPCRYGGEEMAVILSETLLKNAATTAEKLRVLVETRTEEIEGLKVTISLGVSAYSENMNDPDEIINVADKCLYEAKNSGRNKSVSADML